MILPFFPDLAITAVGALAKGNGCVPDQKEICRIAGVNVSDVLSGLVTVTVLIGTVFVLGLAAVWLVACYWVIGRGWVGPAARFCFALSATAIFALLPYLAPVIAVAPLANANCRPNEGGGSCLIFGGDVSTAHHTVILPWLVLPGVPIALATAAVYAIVLAIIKYRRARESRQPVQSS
ncbi:hypothetical protein [Bradyrhizobium sp. 1]|uniref:hypothetical protein n=1 Tax=Bradyrhizobium sp. 1 TaxID=241591 RepID=UPI001FF7D6D4|nr:hypothetical protein [Bradyrhizobium sp. 1]MCK1395802.1 hypothetical protein [Bradyrhizobium sp. 1]